MNSIGRKEPSKSHFNAITYLNRSRIYIRHLSLKSASAIVVNDNSDDRRR
jgi:hypothetical protein